MSDLLPYHVTEGRGTQVPILVSVPHCGTMFPNELKSQYREEMIEAPDDTDWFVDKLYDFAPALGITMISAVYSRWVIDLNRDPDSKPLYTDGRIITGLCPTTDFLGNPIYNDSRTEITLEETKRRLDLYYWPYHHKVVQLLGVLKQKFGKVLLWDCHSIRQIVPTIHRGKFPDLILGSADEKSASREMITSALKNLRSARYSINHNTPFKGGFITRNYGHPERQEHALQLEMSKVNYMDDSEREYHSSRADEMRSLLQLTLTQLAERLMTNQ
jgi:N-formylglutamate deformylase